MSSFLNMETPSTFGHVSSLNIYDPTGAPGRRRARGDQADHPRAHRPARPVPPAADRGAARVSICRTGSRTPTSTSTSTSATTPCRRPAPRSSSPRWSAGSSPAARSGRPLWELYVIEGVDERPADRPADEGAPRRDRRRGGRLDARRDPRPRPRLPPHRRAGAVGARRRSRPTRRLLRITLREYLRRPEKMVRLGVAPCAMLAKASTQSGGLRALADVIAQPMPGPLGSMYAATAAIAVRRRHRQPAGAPTDARAAHAVEPDRSRRTGGSPTRRSRSRTPRPIRRAFGCTFNDVVMALCSGTLRRYLQLARLPARRRA